ncbi:MAG: Rieske 2Fe-2S domain-containing protein [Burkholderiales bacterium]
MAAIHPVTRKESSIDFGRTGPGTLAGRYLRQFWQPVFNSNELPSGRAKPIRIMSEDFTLYRGQTGIAHVVAQRCTHRSTLLHTGWVEGDEIRCLYHGWKFNGNGQCVERPQETTPPGPHDAIKAYPTREHLGLIFVFFGEGEPPPFPPFPGFEEEGLNETRSTVYPCNYFQTHENNFDPCHILWSHSHGITHDAYLSLDMTVQPPPEETEYGTLHRWNFGTDTMRTALLGFMPNAVRVLIPVVNGLAKMGICPRFRDTYLIHVPVDDDSHIFTRTQLVRVEGAAADCYKNEMGKLRETWATKWQLEAHYTAEILAGRLSIMDVVDHPYLATIQDQVAQAGQGKNVDRGLERLGLSDRHLGFMRRIWQRETQALAEGRPIKRGHDKVDCSALHEQKNALRASGAY